MRTWTRADRTLYCGGCGATLERGMPIQLVKLLGVARVRVRCQACVGPAPADLPPLVAPPIMFVPRVPIPVGVHVLPFDYKSAAAGDREPGEEG